MRLLSVAVLLRSSHNDSTLQDVKEGCEVKIRRFSEENLILLHKLAHMNLKGRP